MLKKLVTGQLSLANTFWGWGFCGGVLLGIMRKLAIYTEHPAFVPLSYILKVVLFSAVLSGLTYMLRRKITVLGTIAFVIALVEVVLCGVMAYWLFPMFFY
ncbi:hypothetical protein [Pantoea sp. GbtcB22]|uniref:hypothetical protein n=1 Tax=Pantoea sp. GbtcB22 TaxID=2824767 RepID=UPI001C2F8D4C|nr:hypothetical protein [Pantoea sp. GbtcB22]